MREICQISSEYTHFAPIRTKIGKIFVILPKSENLFENYTHSKSQEIAHSYLSGGQTNEDTCYIAPSVITNPDMNSELMTDEIFGPILIVMEYEDIQGVFRFIREREKPLVTYLFSNNSKLVDEVSIDPHARIVGG